MINGEDPTIRRRQDREAMNERDAHAWQLQRAGWSVRAIARELGMPASSVQRCLQRAQKLAMAAGSPGQVVAVLTDELACEDVTTEADVARLDILERHRLRYLPGEFGHAERARLAAEREVECQQDDW